MLCTWNFQTQEQLVIVLGQQLYGQGHPRKLRHSEILFGIFGIETKALSAVVLFSLNIFCINDKKK